VISGGVRVKRGSAETVKVGLKLTWPAQDEARSERIFSAIGRMLAEVLTPEQAKEFQTQLEAERRKLAGGAS
jgi:Spy/CpxP family protein refolding chaperone